MVSSARSAVKAIDPDKVAIYIRWSTDDQSDGTTLDVQMEGCRHYALSQGWNVTEDLIFIDDGYSGGTLDRPAMTRLRAAVSAGQIDCVIVFKLDRLSRSVVDTVNLVLEEWDDRAHVKSAREPIDTTNHAGKMFFYMLVSYAEWERSVIRERTWGGRLKRAQEGRNPGFNAPYGYRVGPTAGTLEIVDAEAAVVRRIYQLYLTGLGMRTILGQLNAEGLRFREGRPWNDSTLRHILSNPVYVGDLVWGSRQRNPRYGKRSGERERLPAGAPLATREGAFPAIVSRSEFERVQLMKNAKPGPNRGGSGRAVSSRFLLTGLARCGKCGAAILGREGVGRGGNLYYWCSGRNAKGEAFCDCGYINVEKVDAIAVAELRRLYGDKAKRERVATLMRAGHKQRLEALLPLLHQLDRRMEQLQGQEGDLRRQYREKEITIAEFRAFMADLDAETTTLQHQRADLTGQAQEIRSALVNHDQWALALDQIDVWDALTVPQQKLLLRTLCNGLTLYRAPRGSEIQFAADWVKP
ncbi:MAG TPA: recombinase family protein [Symbiobacteriaceae bacterium]|nr:recombinase family protein [Symbiobacteriaceae bacterium]